MLTHLIRPLNADTYPHNAGEYAPLILKAWLEEFPDSQPASRDKEDWIENAVFLKIFKDLNLKYEIKENRNRGYVSAGIDTILSDGEIETFFHTGINRMDQVYSLNYDLFAQKSNMIVKNMLYGASETFKKMCGRKVLLCEPNSCSINEAISDIIPNGGQIFIKTIKKEMAKLFKINPESEKSPIDQINDQDKDFVWSYAHIEGDSAPYFLIQEAIEPKYEYRMFIVGDKIVTGAGCVERFTPLDNENNFDCKMEEIRNKSEVSHCPDLLSRYKDFAEKFAKDYAKEVGVMNAYGLDLCIDNKTGKIAIIEINPSINLGRYASNVTQWVKEIDALGNQYTQKQKKNKQNKNKS